MRGFCTADSPLPPGRRIHLSPDDTVRHSLMHVQRLRTARPLGRSCKMMQHCELGVPMHRTKLDLPQADDIKINDRGPAMGAAGNLFELVPMNLSLSSTGPRRTRVLRDQHVTLPIGMLPGFCGEPNGRMDSRKTPAAVVSWFCSPCRDGHPSQVLR